VEVTILAEAGAQRHPQVTVRSVRTLKFNAAIASPHDGATGGASPPRVTSGATCSGPVGLVSGEDPALEARRRGGLPVPTRSSE
jgi:hypothetical protein